MIKYNLLTYLTKSQHLKLQSLPKYFSFKNQKPCAESGPQRLLSGSEMMHNSRNAVPFC